MPGKLKKQELMKTCPILRLNSGPRIFRQNLPTTQPTICRFKNKKKLQISLTEFSEGSFYFYC
jgi:hypothetical protein